MRFPRFDLSISTEVSDYHIITDTTPEIDNKSTSDMIVSLTTKNAMGDDSSAFSFVLLGTTPWDELVRDNDLVILKVQPNEQVPGELGRIDEPTNDVVIVGLVSEVRIEGSYEDDKKLYRITGQSFQKVFMNFELQIIQQVSATIPGQGWMDANVGVGSGGGGGDGGTSGPIEFSPDASGSDPAFPTTAGRAISSGYGARNTGIPGASTRHPAIDIGGSTSDPIYATQDGVVTHVGTIGGWGQTIRIRHTGDGFHSQYAHLSSYNVTNGQTVKKGQKIGNMGMTGIGSGVHLDFIVSRTPNFPHNALGDTVNPVDYLGGSVNSASTGGEGGGSSSGGESGGVGIETDGGFTSLLANRTVRDVFQIILDRFTEYMDYNFKGQGDTNAASNLEDRLDYTNLDSWVEDEHLMNPLSISSFEGSINQLLIDISTRPFNEYFFEAGYEDREMKAPGTEKSFLILRRTPFDKEDWEELHRAEVSSEHIMSENISVTDLDAYSIYNVIPDDLSDNMAVINARPVYSPKLLPKYGYKMLEVGHKFLGFMDAGVGADGTGGMEGDWQGGSNTDERLAFDQISNELGLSENQKRQWSYIIERESSWNMHAKNPSSGAYGLAQMNPSGGHTVTDSYRNSAYNQLTWMYNYMQERYGGISQAYSFWINNNWY